jgi:SAM-dependent methyltransferase
LLNDISAKILTIDQISEIHYARLRTWLKKYNSFAEKMYSVADENINIVPCSEYNAEFQLQIFGVNSNEIMSPVLDVGCGQSGNLVKHLRSIGINAFGIDRCSFDCDYLGNSDWLEYNYGNEKWGTIISNLGFSNHFIHHNLRSDGDFVNYAKAYMNILQSLLPGGSFYYAPDLPFVEKYLDKAKYSLFKNQLSDYNFMSAQVLKAPANK